MTNFVSINEHTKEYSVFTADKTQILCKVNTIADFSDEEYTQSFYAMCPMRRQRVKRYKNNLQKKCTLAGEWMVRNIIGNITGKPLDEFVILPDEKGKLHLQNESLFFNISHSGDTVAAAVSEKRLGIDIECIRPLSLHIAKKVCNNAELFHVFGKIPTDEELKKEYSDEYVKRFLEIWTAKEAYFKCIGTGITDFHSVDVFSKAFEKIKTQTDKYIMHIVV